MASFRTISPQFWADPFVEALSAQDKLLYIYLFTNGQTSNIGVFESSPRKIAFETALQTEDVQAFLGRMEAAGKIVREGASVLVLNFIRHQSTFGKERMSDKLRANFRRLFSELRSPRIAQALAERYPDVFSGGSAQGMPHASGSDTLSVPYAEGMDTLGINNTTQHNIKRQDTPPYPPQGGRTASSTVFYSEEDMAEANLDLQRERGAEWSEFCLLRQEYDDVRKEGPRTGWHEWRLARSAPGFPGIDAVLAGLSRLKAEDGQWKRGITEGLPRFIRDRMWEMEPRRDRPRTDEGPQLSEETRRRMQELKDKEAARKAAANGGRHG